jgi:glycerol kinase
MPAGLILAIDQGTTNTKGLLVARSGEPVFRAATPVELIPTRQGFVEQDPQLLWESVLKVIGDCQASARESGFRIEAIAISNQRETAVAWEGQSGMPLANAIGWQCGRSAGICARLVAHAGTIRKKAGLPLATLITAGKWAWLLENDARVGEAAARGALRLGTVDSWLVHRLTRGAVHATDFTNASRTGLLDLESLNWDDELLTAFGIPRNALPELRSSSGAFGVCTGLEGLEGVPILAAIGDSHGAMFGHGRHSAGTVKATYGTGSSLMALTASLLPDTATLARTIAWSIGGNTRFALEGNIAMTGSAVEWVGRFLGLANPATDAAALAATLTDAEGVYFVPAMAGLGAPHWDSDARGTVAGLGRSHTSAHLARAAVDAIAFQVADVFFAIEQAAGAPLSDLHTDGGATRNASLMQFQADVLGRRVIRSANAELSAAGAAWLAGLALGWWSSLEEIEALPRGADVFTPMMEPAERDRLYRGWKTAVRRTRLRDEREA